MDQTIGQSDVVMEVYLNELSCHPLCSSKEEAKKRAYQLAHLLKATKQQGCSVVRCPDRGISEIPLCKDYTVADLCNANLRGVEEQLLLSMLRPPYIAADTDAEKAYVEASFSIKVPMEQGAQECHPYGLVAACLNQSFGQNFCSNRFWSEQKAYEVSECGAKGKRVHKVFSFSVPEDYEGEEYKKWLVATRPRKFSECSLAPSQKPCSLSSDHHGNKELKEFAKGSLFPLPYITGVVTSLAYTPNSQTFVKAMQTDAKRIEVVLHWTEAGYGMVVQTTARDEVELMQIAEELEKRFGKK